MAEVSYKKNEYVGASPNVMFLPDCINSTTYKFSKFKYRPQPQTNQGQVPTAQLYLCQSAHHRQLPAEGIILRYKYCGNLQERNEVTSCAVTSDSRQLMTRDIYRTGTGPVFS
jgi:hypothetical protein